MKTAKELLENYQNVLTSFKSVQSETLKSLLNLWCSSDKSKYIEIEDEDDGFRCSVQQFSEVEQVNIVRISLVLMDIEWMMWLIDENNRIIALEDVIDDGAVANVITRIANHLEG